jgi:hypothetical protein
MFRDQLCLHQLGGINVRHPKKYLRLCFTIKLKILLGNYTTKTLWLPRAPAEFSALVVTRGQHLFPPGHLFPQNVPLSYTSLIKCSWVLHFTGIGALTRIGAVSLLPLRSLDSVAHELLTEFCRSWFWKIWDIVEDAWVHGTGELQSQKGLA